MRITKTLATIVAAVLLITGSATGAAFTLEKVFDTNTPVPGLGGATLDGVNQEPALSDGTVLVTVDVAGPVNGLVTASVGSAPVLVFSDGDPMPDGASTGGLNTRGYDISGSNVMFGLRRASTGNDSFFATQGGALQLVAEESVTPIPGGGGTLFSSFDNTEIGSISGESPVFEDTSSSGVYARIGGTVQAIAESGDPSPNGSTYTFFDEPHIDGQNVVFEAGTAAGNTLSGVFGGSPITVASTLTTVPGHAETFTGFDGPDIDGSAVSFRGSGATSDGVYLADLSGPTTISAVAEIGDAVPGVPGQTFSDFIDAGVGLGGVLVAFLGEFDNDAEDVIAARFNGQLHNVIDTTQTLDGKDLTRVDFLGAGVDGNQLAFSASFSDGSEAVYIATIPEPASAALLVLGGLALTARGRVPGAN